MKKGNLLKGLLLAAVLVASAIVTNKGIEAYQASQSPVAKLADFVKSETAKIQGLVGGCVSRGLKDPNVALAIVMSGGQVCVEAMQSLAQQESTDKAICSSGDSDCYFILGYSATSLLLGSQIESVEQIKQIEDEAKEALRVSKEEQ